MSVTAVANSRDTYRFRGLMLAGIVILFVLGDYILPLTQEQRHWWANVFWTMTSLLAMLRCFAVARGLSGQWRKAWFLFGAGCASWFLGMLVWDYRELVLGEVTPFPALSDIGFLLFAPLFAAGLFSYRAGNTGLSFRLMEFSQLGIFTLCIIAAHVVVFYDPLLLQGQGALYIVTALAYPVLYMALLVQGMASQYFYAPGPARRVLGLVLAGISVHAITNSLYAYALLGYDYKVGHYLDLAWILGFLLIYHAAMKQRALAPEGMVTASGPASPRELRFGRMMPPLALLATAVVVIVFHEKLRPELGVVLLPLGLCLILFLALREWASGRLEAQLNKEMRVSEERLRQLTQVAPVGIFRSDAAGHCQYVNERYAAITGLAASEGVGQGWMRTLHPGDRGRVVKAWDAAVVAERDFRDEYRFVRPGGQAVWVLGVAVIERDELGRFAGHVGSVMDISARKVAEQALLESEARFRKVFASSPVMVAICKVGDGAFVDVNAAFLDVTAWRREEVIGYTSQDLNIWVAPEMRGCALERLRAGDEVRGIDWQIRTRAGQVRDVLGSMEIVQLNGEDCLVVVAQDITERRRADVKMRMLSTALEKTADAVMITDREGVIEYVNTAFEAMTGYSGAEVRGKRPNILNSGKQGGEFFRGLWANILAGKIHSDVFINKKKEGVLYYEEKTITPLKDELGEITHFVGTSRDITQRMQTQERLQFLAHHDVLTELPNRSLFIDRLNQALAYARWHERLVAVLFLDIDRFKNINDTLGHEAGDRLLRELATRLGRCLRERDTVARFGGDEFVILLSDVADSADVNGVAQKILDAIKPAFFTDETSLHVTASIGISLFPDDGDDATLLLRNADNAMYRAKELGRNNHQFYSSDLGTRALERLTLENSLRHALERNEFVLHYQPQVDARDRRVVGVEALLRWQHPDLGLIPPLDFVPLLEETGLIVPVGEWILQSACAQLAHWQRQGWPRLRMAVNISGRQFEHPGLAASVSEALVANGLKAADLELEITESILMQQGPVMAAALDALTGLGVRLGMDDFGTGYSSLGYLRRFPIDTLKIDRSFIRDIPGDPEDAAITQAIIVMGQSLKLELVAEGVETAEQLAFLQSHNCQVMQGYYFSRPLPSEDVMRFLSASSGGQAASA